MDTQTAMVAGVCLMFLTAAVSRFSGERNYRGLKHSNRLSQQFSVYVTNKERVGMAAERNGNRDKNDKLYYFVDVDMYSRQVLAWDIETRQDVQVDPGNGCHRVFLSKGQYNKLVTKLESRHS